MAVANLPEEETKKTYEELFCSEGVADGLHY